MVWLFFCAVSFADLRSIAAHASAERSAARSRGLEDIHRTDRCSYALAEKLDEFGERRFGRLLGQVVAA